MIVIAFSRGRDLARHPDGPPLGGHALLGLRGGLEASSWAGDASLEPLDLGHALVVDHCRAHQRVADFAKGTQIWPAIKASRTG